MWVVTVRYEGMRIRLDPNNNQAGFLAGCGGAARVAYNFAVEQLQSAQDEFTTARAAGVEQAKLAKALTAIDIQGRWHSVKTERYPWYDQYPNKLYLFAFRAAVRAHRSWMASDGGFPRFKKWGYTTSFTVCETIELRPGWLQLPKVGEVRIAAPDSRQAGLRRLVRRGRARIMSITVSRDSAGTWWAALTVERTICWQPSREEPAAELEVIGVDLGVKALAVAATSAGQVVLETPARKRLERSERRDRKIQRGLSRKDRTHGKATGAGRPVRSPSNRREKTRCQLARSHRKNSRQRAGHLHTLTKTLAATGATIVLEDLNVKGMTSRGRARKKGLNRRIREAGFGEIRRQLTYKVGTERTVIADRFFPSSKTCSVCGQVNGELILADRTWTCAGCGTVHDRDLNAAVNLAAWGEARKGETRAGDPDTPGPVSRASSARPQRGTPRRPGNRPTPERPDSRADTAGTRPHHKQGVSDLDGPGKGPVATKTRISAKR